jgi:hypothetical protein
MGYAALRPSRRTDRSASEEWLSSRRKWVPTKIGERQSHGIQGTVVRFKAGGAAAHPRARRDEGGSVAARRGMTLWRAFAEAAPGDRQPPLSRTRGRG